MKKLFIVVYKIFVFPFCFVYGFLAVFVFIREIKNRDLSDISVNGIDVENDEFVKNSLDYIDPAIYAFSTILWSYIIFKIIKSII
jgi:cell division septal protein FtsQ